MNVGERLQCISDTIMGHSYETQLSESSHVETLLRNQCNHGSNAGSSSAALLSALYIDSCLLRGCSHQTHVYFWSNIQGILATFLFIEAPQILFYGYMYIFLFYVFLRCLRFYFFNLFYFIFVYYYYCLRCLSSLLFSSLLFSSLLFSSLLFSSLIFQILFFVLFTIFL